MLVNYLILWLANLEFVFTFRKKIGRRAIGNETFYWDCLTGTPLKSYVYHLLYTFTHMHTALVWLNGKAVHGSLILLIFREFSKIFLASAQFRFWLRRHQVSDACKYTNQNIKMSCQSNKLHSHCLATSLHSSSFDCNYILNWKANQVNTSLPSLLKHGWKRHQTHSGPISTPSDFF